MLEQLPDALGEALEEVRAGIDQTLFHAVDLRQGMGAITVGSLAFADHAPIPEKYTADGAGTSPPLHWSGVPPSSSEVVLIVEDADSPTPHPLVHAIAIGIATHSSDAAEPTLAAEGPGDGALAEGALSAIGDREPTEEMGRNSLLGSTWLPPDPPPGHGVHRYVFQVFALEAGERIAGHPGREALRNAVQTRALASGCLIGTYARPSGRIETPSAATQAAVA